MRLGLDSYSTRNSGRDPIGVLSLAKKDSTVFDYNDADTNIGPLFHAGLFSLCPVFLRLETRPVHPNPPLEKRRLNNVNIVTAR